MLDPSRVRYFSVGPATGSIGSLTDAGALGRFDLQGERMALLHAYAMFYGGTSTATLTLYQQRWALKPAGNLVRWTWSGKGGGAAAVSDTYAELGLTEEEMYGFIYEVGDWPVFTWADPSSGVTAWTILLKMYSL